MSFFGFKKIVFVVGSLLFFVSPIYAVGNGQTYRVVNCTETFGKNLIFLSLLIITSVFFVWWRDRIIFKNIMFNFIKLLFAFPIIN